MTERLFELRPVVIPDVCIPDQRSATGRYTVPRPSKLNNAIRVRLVTERAGGATLRELAVRYGVSAETVRLTLKRDERIA